MGSSKTAQALITQYNYEQSGYQVIMLKPKIDTRSRMIKSRIGLKSKCITFSAKDYLLDLPLFDIDFNKETIIIVDECQFCTKEQIEQLKVISETFDVFCYGLLTNFKSELFEGSKRLVEIADKLVKIDHICKCGKQAQVNALFENGGLVRNGKEIRIGDSEYKAMCYTCWRDFEKEK
jgi:thymidine kinase